MLSTAGIDDGNPVERDAEARDHLVQGLTAYLREIDVCRVVCGRHEETASVAPDEGGLWISRRFASRDEALAHFAAAVTLLRPSPTLRVRSNAGESPTDRGPTPDVAGLAGRHEGVWEGRGILVYVQVPAEAPPRPLAVRVYVPFADWPELPLQTLASGLRCHEVLLPGVIAPALPRPPGSADGLAVREFLARAMPPNLAASQCISGEVEGRSSTP